MKLGLIVEGHGEVYAVPLPVRRLLKELAPELHPTLLPPHRVSQGQLVKEDELRRAIELMARKVGDGGRIFVLLDADDDLPCQYPRMAESSMLNLFEDIASILNDVARETMLPRFQRSSTEVAKNESPEEID